MKTYRIEASEVVHYAVEVQADSYLDALYQANKQLADTELSAETIEEYSGYQTDRVLVDNGKGFFEEVEDEEPVHFVENGVRTSLGGA